MGKGFEAYEIALAMVAELGPVVKRLAQMDRGLADQVRRAASSVPLNLAEGARRTGRDRLHCYRIAAGSAAEVRAALRVAQAWGELVPCVAALGLLDRVLAMLWRLTHGAGR